MVERRGSSVAAVLVTRLVADHHRSTAVAIHASLARRSQFLATAAPHHRPQLSCQPTNTHTMAPPGFCNRGEVRYGSIGGLEYEVPQSRLYCLCINVALCSTALRCICRVIQRSSMTMKGHTYYIIFGRPPIGGGEAFPLPPLAAPLHTHSMWHLCPSSGHRVQTSLALPAAARSRHGGLCVLLMFLIYLLILTSLSEQLSLNLPDRSLPDFQGW